MIRLSNIKFNKLPANDEVFAKAIRTLRLDKADIETMQISKHSIDARKKDSIKYVYSVDIKVSDYVENKLLNLKDVSVVKEYKYEADKIDTDEKVVIIGAGPSGLFLALTLIESGVKPIIIERGKRIEEREEDVNKLMENGIFDENSNIVFGEGGAGTFSDGKLTTGVKDKRKAYILDQFVRFGANEEIKYVTKPHIGTDVIRNVVKNIRNFIIDNGGEFLFSTMMTDILVDRDKVKGVILKNPKEEFSLECDTVCLCTGHSSHETFEMLYSKNVNLESKPLAVGVRIEHRREFINISQYGADYNKNLPTAEYKLAVKTNNGRNCYTFCMCPGGVVVPSMSNKNGIVVNGMSYYKRDKDNSNSAILVNVTPDDYIKYTKNDTPLSGIYFQKDLEEKAFESGECKL